MAVADYLAAASDGSALRAANPEAPPPEALRSAALTPLAAPPRYTALLQSSIPVSVLASDPYTVCSEGAHKLVRPLAIALTLLYTLGLPAAGVWLLWATGRLKCLRRCWAAAGRWRLGSGKLTSWDRGAPSAPAPGALQQSRAPGPLATAALAALIDPNLHPAKAWTVFYEMGALAVITGCQTIVQASGSARLPVGLFFLAQGTMAAVCLASAAVLGAGRLYAGQAHAWKQPVKVALNGVAGAAALVNALLVARVGSEFLRLALAATLLALLGLLVLTLLLSWGFSVRQTLQLQGLRQGEEAEEERVEVLSPLQAAAAAAALAVPADPQQLLWRRYTDEDGDVFWLQPATGRSQWELQEWEQGAGTLCGWRHCADLQLWRHEATGVVRGAPPPLHVGQERQEAEAAEAAAAAAAKEEAAALAAAEAAAAAAAAAAVAEEEAAALAAANAAAAASAARQALLAAEQAARQAALEEAGRREAAAEQQRRLQEERHEAVYLAEMRGGGGAAPQRATGRGGRGQQPVSAAARLKRLEAQILRDKRMSGGALL